MQDVWCKRHGHMDRVRSERSTIPAITANKYLFSRFLQSPTTFFLSSICYAFFAFTMSTNSGFRDAPPTKNPSISGCVAIRTPVNPQKIVRLNANEPSSLQLAALTLPPYMIRVLSPTPGVTTEARYFRVSACTSWA